MPSWYIIGNLSKVKKTDINEYGLKGCIFVNVDVVFVTGRSPCGLTYEVHSFLWSLNLMITNGNV